MPVNPAAFDKDSDKLKEVYGEELIRRGSQYSKLFAIPTGSHEFDYAMRLSPYDWGVPIGRKTRLYGGEMTGKTHLIWTTIRNAQNIHHIYEDRYMTMAQFLRDEGKTEDAKLLIDELDKFLARFPDGLECVYYNVEGQFHKDYVASKGVDVDRLHVVETGVIETIGATVESLLGSRHFHAIDSTSTAISLRALNAPAEDENRSIDAKRWGEMFDRIEARFDNEENTLMYVSHTYVEQTPGRPTEVPKGGKRLGYSSDMSLQFRRGHWLYRDKNGMLTEKDQAINTISGQKEPDGIEMVIRVQKSRVCPPFRTARARIGFEDETFDTSYELVQAAKFFNFVKNAGGWYFLLDENGDKTDTKFHGEFKFREHLKENEPLRRSIVDAMMSSNQSRVDDSDAPDIDPDEDE